MARSKFNTAAKLSRIRAPILVVHCTHDPVIAFPLGEEVYRLAGEPKLLLRIEASCHEEASLVSPAEYHSQLVVFLSRVRAKS